MISNRNQIFLMVSAISKIVKKEILKPKLVILEHKTHI